MSDESATTLPPSSSTSPFPSPLPLILPAGGISLLAGSPGVGKTALLAGFLRDLARGISVFSQQPTFAPAVGIVNMDRGWADSAGEWFRRADYPEIRFYSSVDDRAFNPSRLRKKWERTNILFECIDRLQLPPPGIVAVDPVSLYLGGNLIDYDACAVACHEIRQRLLERQLTMIATAHAKKISANRQDRYLRLQDQILGSTALFGFTDTQMYLAAPDELRKDYYIFLWQPHMAPVETFPLERDEQGLFRPYSGIIDPYAPTKFDSTAAVLAFFPLDGAEIAFGTLVQLAEQIPLKRRQLKDILERLMEHGKIEHVRHGVYRRRRLAPVIELVPKPQG